MWTVLAHLSEMVVWSLAYFGLGTVEYYELAAYFSMTTYTTIGYGDVVLPVSGGSSRA